MNPMPSAFPGGACLPRPAPLSAFRGQAHPVPSGGFPVLLETTASAVDLAAYLGRERERILDLLTMAGAVLLRGFAVTDPEPFSRAIAALDPEILLYSERSSPRHAVGDRVYTSTDHPADQDIVLHSEQSYTHHWPCYICFCCHTPATSGGSTPIADNRQIMRALPTGLLERFERYGVRYERTYTPGLGVSWQTAFQTDSKEEVAAFCRARDIQHTWQADGCLKTRQIRSAFQTHPRTGERLWFNHALFFHASSLEPRIAQALIDAVGLANVPTNTFFGNGDAFTEEDLIAMRHAVAVHTRRFRWQVGDVLVLDNMIRQHGRDPFDGPRRVLTLMARPYPSVAVPLPAPGRTLPAGA